MNGHDYRKSCQKHQSESGHEARTLPYWTEQEGDRAALNQQQPQLFGYRKLDTGYSKIESFSLPVHKS
jgi:hypothetical protein